MVGMTYPIDIAFLDDKKRILQTAQLKPFETIRSQEKADYVLESPLGKLSKLKRGDALRWERNK